LKGLKDRIGNEIAKIKSKEVLEVDLLLPLMIQENKLAREAALESEDSESEN
jgi:hypothetical protein